MMNATKQILRSLQELLDDDERTIHLCNDLALERLVGHLDAELGGDLAALDPAVQAHLASCAICREEYGELQQLFQLEQHPSPAAPPAARFDFSYLAGAPEDPVARSHAEIGQSWRLDEVGRLVIRFSAGLLQALQIQQPDFALERSPTEVRYHYALQETLEDCNVTITVGEAAQDNTRREAAQDGGLYTVVVSVEIPSRGGWPNLAGTPVTLKRGDLLLHAQQTDAFGKTAFRNVAATALPQLVFEIG
jgi:hypothetical protein